MNAPASLGDAFALATIAHSGQMYGDRPYITHPVAVAKLILDVYGAYDHLLIPALLHDVVEDTGVTLHDLVVAGFRLSDVETVEAVTRKHGEIYMDFVRRATTHQHGRIVKLADNTHNLSGLPPRDPREGRYRRARVILVAANGGEDPWAHLVPDPADLDARAVRP